MDDGDEGSKKRRLEKKRIADAERLKFRKERGTDFLNQRREEDRKRKAMQRILSEHMIGACRHLINQDVSPLTTEQEEALKEIYMKGTLQVLMKLCASE